MIILNAFLQQVNDHETYIFNLTEANEHGDHRSPVWYKEYQFTEAYGHKDLSPAGLDALLDKMSEDTELVRKVTSS